VEHLSRQERANFKHLFRIYREQAKKRGLAFTLSPEAFFNLTQGDCYLCGEKPLRAYSRCSQYPEPFLYNGLDRIDNSQGYTKQNVASCCKFCNVAKSNLKLIDFYKQIRRIYHVSAKHFWESDKIAA
jgi:hypothetical protein